MLYPCPCCGYLTLFEPSPGTYLVCPICFWEDTGITSGLRQAQRNFIAFGACEQKWLDRVRPPTENDERLPHWQPLDALAALARPQVMAQIAHAFDGVTREDGVSLHEAVENDYWGGPLVRSPEARKLDTDERWQEVPDAWIEKSGSFHPLCYFDPIGWRYYIPAYMLWTLKHYENSHLLIVYQPIYTFDFHTDKNTPDYTLILTQEQKAAICQFLRFMATYGDSYADAVAAQAALAKYWGQFC